MGGSVALESKPVERAPGARPGEWALLGGLSFVVFAAHMLVSGRYGYFVDELYYLACSHHLAWGYVDQPPLIAVITWLERVTLGDSLPALHFLPAVAAGAADGIDRAGIGCAAIWDGIGVHMRDGGADLSGIGFVADDECV
jgi:hypothetical protein